MPGSDPAPVERQGLEIGKGGLLTEGSDLSIIAIGSTVYPALEAAARLKERGIFASVVNARFAKPLDRELILAEAGRTGCLVTVEENAVMGGFGSAVLELLADEGLSQVRVKRIGIPDRYIEQGTQARLRADLGLDSVGIAATCEAFVKGRQQLAPQLACVK